MQQFLPNYGIGYNPMLTPQQRIAQFEQQYTQNFVTIPVTNVDEANAFRVDLNGTPTFFYNAGKNEVYLKRTNTRTGFADFIVFGALEQPRSEEKPKAVINTYEKDFKALNDKIDNFSLKLEQLSLLIASNQTIIEEVEEEPVKAKGGKYAK